MNIDLQRLGYKLHRADLNYSQKMQENLKNSQSSFNGIETPGWSSMIKSELSDRNRHKNKDQTNLKQQILQKIRKDDKIEWTQQDENKMILRNQDTFQINPQPRIKRIKKEQINKQNINKSKQKRFKAISVHQHLYQQGVKQSNKKMLRKIVDEQIKKKQVFPFRPSISERSHQLAQLKYSRAQSQSIYGYHQKRSQYQEQTKPSEQIWKQNKQVQRFRLLNELFYYLSEGEQLITDKNLNNTVQELPLFLIKQLEPLMERIFKGRNMEWINFLQFCNSKIKNKDNFVKVFNNWLTKKIKN